MTLPYERTNAVNYTREFLYEMLDPKKTPKIPKNLRQRALSLLRHYPCEYDMERVSKNDTSLDKHPVFGENNLGNNKNEYF